ncbi:pyridoxamine 5'-phosphate oxidase family protein [Leifsonia sp. NPDC058292]|uniref:pyridoxamine 5'-phosphate oxidase family protein n=1 Tax=Leifsonia sp. NPDC058292 TaxID=3346428 RepID=UPI0036DA664A
MPNRSDIERVIAANLYLVVATTDDDGRPWVSPVFFAPLGEESLCWVSSPDSRHSRNIAQRPDVAITVFDSGVAVGRAEAAYFEATASRASADDLPEALSALNGRLPVGKQVAESDLEPEGPMVLYRADIDRRFVLVRGGDPERKNALDMTLEV